MTVFKIYKFNINFQYIYFHIFFFSVNDESSQVEELNIMIQKDATVSQHLTPAKNSNETPPEAVSLVPPMRDHFLMSNYSQQYPHCHGSPFGFHDQPATFHDQQNQNNHQHQWL